MYEKYLLTCAEVATIIGFAPATVKKWVYGQNTPPADFPAALQVGGRIRYRRADIEIWIAGIPPRMLRPHPQTALPRGRGRPRKMPRMEEGAA